MLYDTIRNGKAVTIEIVSGRVVGASVDVKQTKQPKITKAMKKLGREPKVVNSANPTAQRVGSTKPKDGRDAAPSPSFNGKPVGKDLDFALAVISAIRFEHQDEPMVIRALASEEISELTHIILNELGKRGCSKQNISRIEGRAQRKARLNKDLQECLKSYLGK